MEGQTKEPDCPLLSEAGLKTETERLSTADGESLFFRKVWDPNAKPRALITFVHGLGEHNGRYDYLFVKFAKEGYIIHSYDQRGHGHSTGTRGHSPSYETSLDDLTLVFNKCESEDSSLPHFLYGHSLGGGMVLRYAFHHKQTGSSKRLDGVIASAPFIRTGKPVPALKKFFGQLLAPMLPWAQLDNGLDLSGLAQNPEVGEVYKKDPHVHSYITLGLADGALKNGELLLTSAKDFPVPLYLFHGDADVLTSFSASKEFFDSIDASQDKTFKHWPGGYHEMHNDYQRDEVIQDIINWLSSKTSSS